MFKKTQRYSFKKGIPLKSLNSRLFGLRYQKNEQGEFACAFVVSKKIDKKAVVRHRIKRRFAVALAEILKNKSIFYDLVFFVRKYSLDKNIEEIKEEMQEVLNKLK